MVNSDHPKILQNKKCNFLLQNTVAVVVVIVW